MLAEEPPIVENFNIKDDIYTDGIPKTRLVSQLSVSNDKNGLDLTKDEFEIDQLYSLNYFKPRKI